MFKVDLVLKGEAEMLHFGECLANVCHKGDVIYLHGQLGAGKTTLVRGFLKARGYEGNVKSPTYTLVEHYSVNGERIYHFDLYRLGDPSELEYMGIRDYFQNHAICLIEWAEHGAGYLREADLDIKIVYHDADHRRLYLEPVTLRGRKIYQDMNERFGLFSASSPK